VAPDDLPFALTPCPKPLALGGSQDGGPKDGAAHRLTLIETGVNGGFAFGVNAGLARLAADPEVERFWILNPDSVVPPQTARAFATEPGPAQGFALMGGRVLYLDSPDIIQIDGGLLDRRTGVTGNIGLYQPHSTTPPPPPARLAFITGASMVASRTFYDRAGPMPEEYFLYYEEVDWALGRGDLPLAYCPGAVVYHRAGTAIGSPAPGRPASPFSLYFKHRGRLRFVRRHFPRSVLTAQAYSLAKAAQLLLKGYPAEAGALLSGAFDLAPPAAVRARLSGRAADLAFAPDAARQASADRAGGK
jgi:GT2 family glycosyltransferase